MQTFHAVFNGVEGFFWAGIGVAVWIRGWRGRPVPFRFPRAAAVAFVAFGLSDGLEIVTGAWWRPLPLLILNAACLASLVFSWQGGRRV